MEGQANSALLQHGNEPHRLWSWPSVGGRFGLMLDRAYTFETDRLQIREWHSASWPSHWEEGLARFVAGILTEPVTRTLPVSWHGAFTEKRARDWIAERDREGSTLLVAEKATANPVGLVILFDSPSEDGIELRLGYLLAESSWAMGFATEVVDGLVRWCRAHPSIRSLAGGVSRNNPASRRVLEKNGFLPSEFASEREGSEEILRLILRPP